MNEYPHELTNSRTDKRRESLKVVRCVLNSFANVMIESMRKGQRETKVKIENKIR